jgi:predicted RNA methylase
MIENIELKRLEIQKSLDKGKTEKERNILGQFSTPPKLATSILKEAIDYLGVNSKISFLDPAIGTGVFYKSLIEAVPEKRISKAKGIEIDEYYAQPSLKLWSKHKLDYTIGDFTKTTQPSKGSERFNLIVCNPPYVRHHHLNGSKSELHEKAMESANVNLSSLSGLYCYFMALSIPWMKKNGIAIWLIPSEFMEVNYGEEIKRMLCERVTLLQIHHFDPDDLQFDDALVTSAIVIIKNQKPNKNQTVKFTSGIDLHNPKETSIVEIEKLNPNDKWTRIAKKGIKTKSDGKKLKDLFKIRRGIATGDNKFFIITKSTAIENNIPFRFLKPILPSPKDIKNQIIDSDKDGFPIIEKQLFVLDCNLEINEIEKNHPGLFNYLKQGIECGVTERYICKNRSLWYKQESREPAPFYFTYIGRKNGDVNSFRFILNKSKAIVTNSLLMINPIGELLEILNQDESKLEELLIILNEITTNAFLENGRAYGGGMRKFEPKELSNVDASIIDEFVKKAKPITIDMT